MSASKQLWSPVWQAPPIWSTSSSTASPSQLPVKRTTFVIDTDRTVLEVISSEVNMDTHADQALEVLRARNTKAS